jgi:hypothetical protein
MSDHTTEVDKLIKKAADADVSDDAMRFAQAACNAAKASRELSDIPKGK